MTTIGWPGSMTERKSDYVLVPSPEFDALLDERKPAFARMPDAEERARIRAYLDKKGPLAG